MRERINVWCAVEGMVDEAVVTRLLESVGLSVNRIYGKKGKEYLKKQIPSFNNAARISPWVILVDLDWEECAPALVKNWLSQLPGSPAPFLSLRVAVREVEAWLLGDQERMAKYLGVSTDLLPLQPEELKDPKNFLINLAVKSKKRKIREGIAPRPKSGIPVGPEYTALICDYARNFWRPEVAAQSCPSLQRALRALSELKEKWLTKKS